MITQELNLHIAITQVSFDYYSQCRKAGATDAEAKAEMLTKAAQDEIAKRVLKIIKKI